MAAAEDKPATSFAAAGKGLTFEPSRVREQSEGDVRVLRALSELDKDLHSPRADDVDKPDGGGRRRKGPRPTEGESRSNLLRAHTHPGVPFPYQS